MIAVIIFISICSAAFAILLARHDEPAVTLANKLAKPEDWQMAIFHRYNWWVKFCFCLMASWAGIPSLLVMFSFGMLAFLWIYLIFDPALSVFRPGFSWNHIGDNDADGRRWIKWFGSKNAGRWKAVILLFLIAVTIFIEVKYLYFPFPKITF